MYAIREMIVINVITFKLNLLAIHRIEHETHRHHRDRGAGRKPVRFVISAGIIADIVEVTEHKRHSAEARQAGAGPAKVLQNEAKKIKNR